MSPDVVELTRKLVAVPSESALSVIPVMDALAEALEPLGFTIQRYDQKVTHSGHGPKINMVCERGHGRRRLVFSGHLDTVPVGDDSQWSHDPFGGDGIVDGKLYGRGSVDMKGQVAAMALACASAPDDVLDEITLTLSITADEEVGHLGIKGLTSEHVFQNAVGAIVGEPTDLKVVRAHKGGMTLKVTVFGISAHSSTPKHGVNAIDQAARLITRLEDGLREWTSQRTPAFEDEPPTFTVAQIRGGVADNVVPDRCEINISGRALVMGHFDSFRQGVAHVIERLRDEDARVGLPEERRFRADTHLVKWAPPMICDTETPLYRLVAGFVGQSRPLFVTYGTDGGVLDRVGLPSVVWGHGDIARAHKPNEYVTVDELRAGLKSYSEIIPRIARAQLPTVTTKRWQE